MEKTYQATEIESASQDCVLTQIKTEIEQILNLQDFDYYVQKYDLRRGEQIIVREIEVTANIVTERCWRHGFNGQKREIVKNKKSKTLSEQSMKLWHTKKRGWYWK
jgi:hypothetical protein